MRVSQEWPELPFRSRSLKALLDVESILPHVLDFVAAGGHLITSFPKLVHDFGIDFRFCPQRLTVDAPAASIYDDDEMLCSILCSIYDDAEIEEVQSDK